ncbi:MAG: Maf family protein [Planctomycetaceae bacterium]|nr:Maf family protein [Planctomycetaceae bacterium]
MAKMRIMKMQQSQFILASASPRRKQLLIQAGYIFDIVPSTVDESAFDSQNVTPEQYARRLALAKAQDVAVLFSNAPVVGSDTVVDLDGEIIGKPEDAAHAELITRKLFSKPHKVISGLAVIWIEKNVEIVRADTTVVYPRKLTEPQIAEHIRQGDWQGKAGAYGIQETGDEFVDHIEGSFTNVMGLPMELLEHLLATLGIHPNKKPDLR